MPFLRMNWLNLLTRRSGKSKRSRTRVASVRDSALESRVLLSNTIVGTVYLDANLNGSRDGVGLNPVSGVALGPRGPVVLSSNDDGSTAGIPLGFTFELYGTAFNQAFVNNNGNVTFNRALSAYSPQGFPQTTPIVAPFWADIDTRSGLGAVHQSVGTSPRGRPYFQVDWVNVGRYSQQGNLRNDFSLYIEDDPAGDIVAFFYRRMQWTTSGGNGFGGTGAQIGFDSGNGTNFLSFGRPSTPSDISYFNTTQVAFRVSATGSPEPVQLESGAAAAQVYIDANVNGVFDTGEPLVTAESDNPATLAINEAGRFRFENLPAGTYVLRQILPGGFMETAPVGGSHTVVFAGAGEVVGGRDFGRAQAASVSGRVLQDSNRNSTIDASDEPLAGITVYLDSNNDGTRGTTEPVVVTGADGSYRFDRLLPGTRTIRALPANGRRPLQPASGSRTVTLSTGQDLSGSDFLFNSLAPPRILAVTPSPSAAVATGVSSIAVRFDSPIDSATFWGPLFSLVGAGGDGQFGTRDDAPVPLTFSAWDSATRTMTLSTEGLLARGSYRFVATDAIVDEFGNALDGEYSGQFPTGNGVAGGSFTSTFTVTNVPPTIEPYFGTTVQTSPLDVFVNSRDPDGTVTAIRIVRGPDLGTLVPGEGLGRFTYTPQAGYSGIVRFALAAFDGMAEGTAVECEILVTTSPVNFRVDTATADTATQLRAAGPATVRYTVRNLGPGTTVNLAGLDWTDELFLSFDDRFDSSDQRIGKVEIDTAGIAPDGTYSRTATLQLPFAERTGPAFIVVRANADRRQMETDLSNNEFAIPITLTPSVDILNGPGSFLGRNRPFLFRWRDADSTANATISLGLDTDSNPANGAGQTILVTTTEDADRGADQARVSLPSSLPSGSYFLWARIDSAGGTTYSTPVPVRVFAEVFEAEDDAGVPVGGGAYEVFGVDLAREGDSYSYRVRTNFDPLGNTGEVYINIGGSYQTGGGRLAALGVRNRVNETGQQIQPGTLYNNVTFAGGVVRPQHPIFARSYGDVTPGGAPLQVSQPTGRPWRYEINGTVALSALGITPADPFEIGWGMYCGNDFSSTNNGQPKLNLTGDGLLVEQSSADASGNGPRRQWGSEVMLAYEVKNTGNTETGATTVRFVLSSDATVQLNHVPLEIVAGSAAVGGLLPGEIHYGRVTVRLPASAPEGFESAALLTIGMISDSGNAIAETSETDNFNVALATDKVQIRLGRPEFVNVLIHGYALGGSFIPGQYQSMWSAWDRYAEGLLAKADTLGDPVLVGNVATYVTKWRSSEGWEAAFGDSILELALSVMSLRNPVWVPVLRAVQAHQRIAMLRAEAFAYDAARRTVEELLNSNGASESLVGDPERQWIHVIGHSRGGAVGARVARLLVNQGYRVRHTGLDPYSSSWPSPSDALADIDIFAELFQGSSRRPEATINYLVQEGLLRAFGPSGLRDLFEGLGLTSPVDIPDNFLDRAFSWKSLSDARFTSNPVMPGDDERSNHLNIDNLYFDFNHAHPEGPYAALRNAAASRRNGVAPSALAGDSTVASNDADLSDPFLNRFIDGDFEQTGEVQRLIEDLGPNPSVDDSFVDSLIRLLTVPGYAMNSSLDVAGNANVVREGVNSVLQLVQESDTRFSELLSFDSSLDKIRFRMSVLTAGAGDVLQVRFGDQLVSTVDLASRVGFGYQTIEIPMSAFANRTGEMHVTFAGPTSTPAVIQLDDFTVTLRRPPAGPSLAGNTVAENVPGDTVIGTLSAIDPDAGDVVQFSLVDTAQFPDNAAFALAGNQLRTAAPIDFESRSSYTIRVRATDQTGLFTDSTLTIIVTNVNESPTALSLSNTVFAENVALGTPLAVFNTSDPDVGNSFTYELVAGGGASDNAAFTVFGNQLRSAVLFSFETKPTYSIRVRTRDQGDLSFEQTFTITVTNVNSAPVLDNSGNIFTVLGVGSRQSAEMLRGTLVSEILARGAGGNPISDPDAGAVRGIALTNIDRSLGTFQYTLVTNNPAESDWIFVEQAGVISDANALLLPTTARLRYSTPRMPHHEAPSVFLALESKLDVGITFRAWDQMTGIAGGRGNASVNGGATAFSVTTETVKVYFEARLFRHFNRAAELNVYTLEAEFNALAAGNNPAFEDRSTDAWSGFTVLLSNVPELATTALYRMYYGVQFNTDGTEIDMGYRYLTTNLIEIEALESRGPANKRSLREGTYFREQGVNGGTGILGYIYTTPQVGTQQLWQMYRSDIVQKPTRPPGTREGDTPTSRTRQENGDHVYTTSTQVELAKVGAWGVESPRGFVRPLGGAGIIAPATAAPVVQAAVTVAADAGSDSAGLSSTGAVPFGTVAADGAGHPVVATEVEGAVALSLGLIAAGPSLGPVVTPSHANDMETDDHEDGYPNTSRPEDELPMTGALDLHFAKIGCDIGELLLV
jgi:hypothetical protein